MDPRSKESQNYIEGRREGFSPPAAERRSGGRESSERAGPSRYPTNCVVTLRISVPEESGLDDVEIICGARVVVDRARFCLSPRLGCIALVCRASMGKWGVRNNPRQKKLPSRQPGLLRCAVAEAIPSTTYASLDPSGATATMQCIVENGPRSCADRLVEPASRRWYVSGLIMLLSQALSVRRSSRVQHAVYTCGPPQSRAFEGRSLTPAPALANRSTASPAVSRMTPGKWRTSWRAGLRRTESFPRSLW